MESDIKDSRTESMQNLILRVIKTKKKVSTDQLCDRLGITKEISKVRLKYALLNLEGKGYISGALKICNKPTRKAVRYYSIN